MSHKREKRARQAARLALMTAVSLEATLFGQTVLADNAPPAPTPATNSPSDDGLQEIVVTGFRASLESALNLKRQSDLPIESIAPEDLGKLPDQNVAEALQRLPGIQIDRSQGQGTAVLIDGLRQNLTTLNGDVFLTGREFYVSGEASGGGSGSNAQYSSLEGIPSELVSGIDVYKNPKASMTEGGLGGTIDLKTANPLAGPMGLSLGGNYRESESQRDNGWTPDATLVGAYKVNDRLAFTASLSHDKENTHTEEFQDQNRNQWLITNSATPPYPGVLTPAGITKLNQYYIEPQLAYFSDIFDDRNVDGASLGVAFKITDDIETSLKWFYSREQDTTYTYSDKAWFNGQGQSPGNPLPGIDPTQPYSIDGNGVVQSGTFNALGAETASLYQQDIDQANNFQWVTKFNNGGPLRAILDGSFARATSNLQAAQADVEHGMYTTSGGAATSPAAPGCNNGNYTTCQSAPANPGYQFTYANGGTGGLPSVNYVGNYSNVLNNPAFTTFKSNWAWANLTTQEQYAIKLDGAYDLPSSQNFSQTLSAGIRFGSRSVDEVFGRYLINGTEANGQIAGSNTGCNTASAPNTCGPWLYYQDPGYGTPNIPYSTAVSNPSLASTVPNFAVGNIIVKNPSTSGLNNPSTYLNQVWAGAGVPNNTEQFFVDHLSSFQVTEHTTAVYLMDDLGSLPETYHLNVGLRVVNTQLTINNGEAAQNPTYYGTASWNGVDSNVVPVTTSRSYTNVLPSLNFVYDLTQEQKLRFSAAEVVAPQDLYSLGLGNSYGFTRGTTGFQFSGGSSGNPHLDPYRATQFYASWEDYFAPSGLLSVGGFYKKVQSFVETQNIPTTVGGTTADVTEPVNAGGGKIYGLELGAQYAFGEALTPLLSGLGAAANYTYSQSTSDQSTSFANSTPIPGVSKNSVTGQVYYEHQGFSVRVAYSWRDKAINDSLVGSTFSFPDQNGVQHVYSVFSAPYGQLDGQVGYDFNKHFGILASVENLTDEAQHTYLQWPNLPFTYDRSGARYFVGFKGKL
jgi:TonB-dependent receptor